LTKVWDLFSLTPKLREQIGPPRKAGPTKPKDAGKMPALQLKVEGALLLQ